MNRLYIYIYIYITTVIYVYIYMCVCVYYNGHKHHVIRCLLEVYGKLRN